MKLLEDLEERFMNESDPLKQGEIKQIIFDEFGVDRKCNRCTNQVLISDIKGYPYLCFECDENLFEFETYKDIEMVIGSTQKNAGGFKWRYSTEFGGDSDVSK